VPVLAVNIITCPVHAKGVPEKITDPAGDEIAVITTGFITEQPTSFIALI
jgi:hypothetical protein